MRIHNFGTIFEDGSEVYRKSWLLNARGHISTLEYFVFEFLVCFLSSIC